MADYTLIEDGKVIELAEMIIQKFPEKFAKVQMNDISFCFKDSPKSTFIAKTSRITGAFTTLTDKKINMTIWKEHWDKADDPYRALLMYHELSHIMWDGENDKYALIKHDIQDFAEILNVYGVEWQNREKFLRILKGEEPVNAHYTG